MQQNYAESTEQRHTKHIPIPCTVSNIRERWFQISLFVNYTETMTSNERRK